MTKNLDTAIVLMDEQNANDPNKTIFEGTIYPKELLYAQRMTHQLLAIYPNASEELQLAVRAQHISRWKIDRKEYAMNRTGYFLWRNDLKKMHSALAGEILKQVGYDSTFIARVSFLIHKKQLKKDEETQQLEDVACLVFLKYYFDEFIAKHTDEKIIDIVKKTWGKMSVRGQEAALRLKLSKQGSSLVKKALV